MKHTPQKNEILLFATTWIDLEGIMLNEINETEKCMLLHMSNLKREINTMKQQQTDIKNKIFN